MAVSHEMVTASTGRSADQWKSSVSACKLELELSLPKDSGRDGNGFVDDSLEPTNVQVSARTLPSTALLHPWRTKRRGLAQYGPVQRRKAGRSPGIWGRSRPRSSEPPPQQNARLREGRCNVATFPSETLTPMRDVVDPHDHQTLWRIRVVLFPAVENPPRNVHSNSETS